MGKEATQNHYLVVVKQWLGETEDPARLYVVRSTSLTEACIRAISVRSHHATPSKAFIACFDNGSDAVEDEWQYENQQRRLSTFSSWPGTEGVTGRTYTLSKDNIMIPEAVATLLAQKYKYIQ
jgi:hypothetical protein